MVITSHIFTRSNGNTTTLISTKYLTNPTERYWFIINYMNVMLILKLYIKISVKKHRNKKTEKVNAASNESL
jgi:hypothetical protein